MARITAAEALEQAAQLASNHRGRWASDRKVRAAIREYMEAVKKATRIPISFEQAVSEVADEVKNIKTAARRVHARR